MSLFFGLAFESFYARGMPNRPGGIRIIADDQRDFIVPVCNMLAYIVGALANTSRLGAFVFGNGRKMLVPILVLAGLAACSIGAALVTNR